MRALEVWEATGRSLSSFHDARVPGPLSGVPVVKVFLAPDREQLRQRIDTRFRAMIEMGALEEVRRLAARHLDPMLPVMRAHGVPGLIDALEGRASLEQAIARGQADTRTYAKRQFTFFRHQLRDWAWAAPENAEESVHAGLLRLDQSGA
jgi:tRNA dimethylallyltransferase